MNDDSKIPELHREQLVLGELPADRRAAVLARLGDAAEGELATLRASNAEILAAHPPAAVAREVRRRAELRRSPVRKAMWFGAPAVAAAVVIVVVWPERGTEVAAVDGPGEFVRPADPGETRIKGLAPHLVLHRQAGDTAEPLQAPARARAGDVLQVSYVAAGAAHGVVVSLDGGGVVTQHFPAPGSAATSLEQGGAIRLAQSYELDDAPAFERFVFVTAAGPVDPAQVVAAARALAAGPEASTRPLALPHSWQQVSFLVQKVP